MITKYIGTYTLKCTGRRLNYFKQSKEFCIEIPCSFNLIRDDRSVLNSEINRAVREFLGEVKSSKILSSFDYQHYALETYYITNIESINIKVEQGSLVYNKVPATEWTMDECMSKLSLKQFKEVLKYLEEN